MIDKYCVYIYSLHYVQREYIYHTTNRAVDKDSNLLFHFRGVLSIYTIRLAGYAPFESSLKTQKGGWDSNTTAICQYSDVRTDCAPLKKVRGEGLTFQSQSETLWYLCIPKGVPPRGQTSINQFLFEKSILDDAFHNVVNDAVNDVIAIAAPRDAPVSDGR